MPWLVLLLPLIVIWPHFAFDENVRVCERAPFVSMCQSKKRKVKFKRSC